MHCGNLNGPGRFVEGVSLGHGDFEHRQADHPGAHAGGNRFEGHGVMHPMVDDVPLLAALGQGGERSCVISHLLEDVRLVRQQTAGVHIAAVAGLITRD